MDTRLVPSTCKECYVGCGSIIQVQNDRVLRIGGNQGNPHSKGAFCIKGMNAPIAALDHPDRILYPLRRMGERGEGRFERVSWDEATDAIARRIGEVVEKHGGRSIAGAVSNQFYDRGVAMALLLRCLGSPNYMINQDLCQGCRSTAALLSGITAHAGNELGKARCILVVGKSPSDSNIIEWMNTKSAKTAGAKLIVVDPRRTTIAQSADLWLAPRPGTDAALALSMVHVIFEEQLTDVEFVSKWCTGTDELRSRAAMYPPAVAAEITGIPQHDIESAARMFALTKPGCSLLGHGIDAQANGVQTAMAFNALLALTGNIDRPGTNRLPKQFRGFREYNSFIHDPAFGMPADKEREIIGGDEFPFWSGPHSWGKACHNPSVISAILTNKPYPVKALYASGVNIVCTYPGMQNTIAALHALDLFIVATDQMTPTAQLADYVLPKTTQLEEEAVFIEDTCVCAMQRVTPRRGEVKSDIEIAIALRDALRRKGLLQFELMPWDSHREFIDFQLKDTGISFEDVTAKGYYEFPFDYEAFKDGGFNTPSRKIEFLSSRLVDAGYDGLPDYRQPDYATKKDGYGLILVTGIRTMALHHSRFRNHAWSRKIQNVPELRLHPATAERHGIGANDWIWVETPRGASRVYLKAKMTEELPENIVATGMGWWFPEVTAPDRGALTFNVEAAIPYGPHWDPISGSSESRNVACRIGRADPGDIPHLDEIANALTVARSV